MFVQSHRKQQKLWLGLVFTFLSVLLVSPAPDQLVGFFVFFNESFLSFHDRELYMAGCAPRVWGYHIESRLFTWLPYIQIDTFICRA